MQVQVVAVVGFMAMVVQAEQENIQGAGGLEVMLQTGQMVQEMALLMHQGGNLF